MAEYKVRPFVPRSDLADAFRIQINHSDLVRHGLEPGNVCSLQPLDGHKTVVGIAWAASQKLDNAVVRASSTFIEAHGLKHTDRYILAKGDGSLLQDVRSLVLTEVRLADTNGAESETPDKSDEWISSIKNVYIKKLKYVSVGTIFQDVKSESGPVVKKTFKVAKTIPNSREGSLFRCSGDVRISLQSQQAAEQDAREPLMLLRGEEEIGGLHVALRKIKEVLRDYSGEEDWSGFPPSFQTRFRGLLLYGPPGTGKSLIQSKIQDGDLQTFDASLAACDADGYPIAELNRLFKAAELAQPSVLLIGSLERWAESPDRLSRLISALERLAHSRVLVLATSSDPKRLDRYKEFTKFFSMTVEVPPPDSLARAEILKVLTGCAKNEPQALLDDLAERTHGYVGRDLCEIVVRASTRAKTRVCEARGAASAAPNGTAVNGASVGEQAGVDGQVGVGATAEDFDQARKEVSPSAMREVFLEVPDVRWSDIGGQDEIKEALVEELQWPLLYPELYQRGPPPEKGMLLYGPPGCSKTMIAKAVASEVGLNFLAVKGAEILNKYVGESERNLRDVFARARAAAPSILFFDEIDAIGRGADAGGSSTGDLHVVTTFLNEMDGIEDLTGVFVLAATNRPELMDPALMRPGRLGKHLYVGPPDRHARLAILNIHLARADMEDVSLDWLADESEGYSGAEVVEVCHAATRILRKDKIRAQGNGILQTRHFQQAMEGIPRQITPEMVEGYMLFKNRRS